MRPRPRRRWWPAIGLALVATTAWAGEPTAGERPAAVAGQFYPAAADRLEAAVRAFLDDAIRPDGGRPLALVAPHAGYVFSGQIAADAYRQALGHDYDVVVILGTNHTTPAFQGVSVHPGTGYRTPLGLAAIDHQVSATLAAASSEIDYRPEAHAREHSVEVQVPFVQVALPGVPIVAAIVGAPDVGLCRRFGKILADSLGDRRALIVASTDLSHYPRYDDAVAVDLPVLAAMADLTAGSLQATTRRLMSAGRPGLATCACGEAPAMAALEAARHLGATRTLVVSYANSGDSALGDRKRVVGYGAVALTAGDGGHRISPAWRPRAATGDETLSAGDRQALLGLARRTIARHLDTGTAPLARPESRSLWRPQGAFVTLKKRGRLRGCIGHTAADRPLAQVVGAMALQAAFGDRRFPPVSRQELDEIEIEISLLSPMRPVGGLADVVLGRDGVVLRKDGRSALFLPEVAVEQGWTRAEMMDQLSRKAGLEPGSWRQGAELLTFRSETLREGESEP